MNDAVAAALIGVGGVVFGVVLTAVIDHRSRKHVSEEQREQARHARELVAAEYLDEALIRASAALDREPVGTGEGRYAAARDAYQEGWVAYSPRIGRSELRERYHSVGVILDEVLGSGLATTRGIGRIVMRAITNARATLAPFMRGEELPATTFPEAGELIALIGQGDGTDDPMQPLKDWISAHPEPTFHESPRA